MTEGESPDEPNHAEKLGRRKRPNRSLKVLSSGSHENWPANLGELLEWYANEVEDVTRAAQLRLRSAAKVIEDYRRGGLTFDEATKSVFTHEMKWGDILPGGIEGTVRGKSDEEIDKAIDETTLARKRRESEGRY